MASDHSVRGVELLEGDTRFSRTHALEAKAEAALASADLGQCTPRGLAPSLTCAVIR